MSRSYCFIYFLVLLIGYSFKVSAQTNCGYVAGYCCYNAPVICDLNCLEGFQGQLFPANSDSIVKYKTCQPSTICNTGGTPQNMSWFAFVAGSNYAKITIIPSNCANNKGIQAGLFGDCFFDDDLKGGVPVIEEYIDCEAFPAANIPIVLESDKLNIGQTYYFYVDGQDYDVCKYTVKVDKAIQADTIPDMIEFDQSNDTMYICQGVSFDIGKEDYNLTDGYYWKIVPSNTKYPQYNDWKRTESKSLNLSFDDFRTYTVMMYAYNGCDATDTLKKTIIVRNFSDEDFGEVTICDTDFPYAGPQNIDPNGDGIIGWQGPNINFPGEIIYNVFIANGCRYQQKINVNTFPIAPAEKVTLVECSPFTYKGELIDVTRLNVPLILKGANKFGCDSFINYDAYVLNIEGRIDKVSCINGFVDLKFNLSSISAPPGYKLSYLWKDASGTIIPDNDTDPTTRSVNKKMRVYLEVEIESFGKKCKKSIADIEVDPLAQKPEVPIPLSWNKVICANASNLMNYTVSNNGNVINYNWVWSNGNLTRINKETAQLDVSGVEGKIQICVSAANACTTSDMYCDSIEVIRIKEQLPSDFEVCEDSILIFQVDKNADAYKWTTNDEVVFGSLNSNGPLRIRFNNPPNSTINLEITKKGCKINENANVKVKPTIGKPIISSTSFSNRIDVIWTSVPCAKNYNIYINDVLQATTSDLKYSINNLVPNQSVKFSVEAVTGDDKCACGSNKETKVLSSIPCSGVSIKAISPKSIICEGDWNTPVQMNHAITGIVTSPTIQWSGKGISSSGLFEPSVIKEGKYKLFVELNDMGCIYKDSIEINLVKSPTINPLVKDPDCKEETTGVVDILSNAQNILNYILDGKIVEGPKIQDVSIGNHTIEIIDGNNCKVLTNITVKPPLYPEFSITTSDEVIYDDKPFEFNLIEKNKEGKLIDSIVWYINGEVFCSGKCFNIELPKTEAGIYNHQVVVFYKNCSLEEEFALEVKQSPKIFYSNIINLGSTDPKNRFFSLVSNDSRIEIKKIAIFSRWGERIFYKDNFLAMENQELWDGTFNGKQLNPGVFVLQIEYINHLGEYRTILDDLTIIR